MKRDHYAMAHRFQDGVDTHPGKHLYRYSIYRGKSTGSEQQFYEVMRRMKLNFRISNITKNHFERTQLHQIYIYYEIFE